MRKLFFDTETTGLKVSDGHKVIQLAIIEYIDGVKTGKVYNQMFNPERSIDAEAQGVHGISIEMLKDKPRFKDCVDKILEFIAGAELIAHNAKFDSEFMNAELMNVGSDKTIWECCGGITDTLVIAKKLYPGKKNNLDALCDRLGIDRSNRGKHDALKDTELLADVYFKIKELHPGFDMNKQNYELDVPRNPIIKLNSKPSLRVLEVGSDDLDIHNKYIAEIKPKEKKMAL